MRNQLWHGRHMLNSKFKRIYFCHYSEISLWIFTFVFKHIMENVIVDMYYKYKITILLIIRKSGEKIVQNLIANWLYYRFKLLIFNLMKCISSNKRILINNTLSALFWKDYLLIYLFIIIIFLGSFFICFEDDVFRFI